MKRKLFCVLAPALCALTSYAQTYSLSRDFALANPNGPWSYGWQTFLGSTAPPPTLLAYAGTNTSGNGVPIQVRAVRALYGPTIMHNAPIILHNATSSTDLLDWAVLTNVVNAAGGVQIVDPAASRLPQRFYRTRITD